MQLLAEHSLLVKMDEFRTSQHCSKVSIDGIESYCDGQLSNKSVADEDVPGQTRSPHSVRLCQKCSTVSYPSFAYLTLWLAECLHVGAVLPFSCRAYDILISRVSIAADLIILPGTVLE